MGGDEGVGGEEQQQAGLGGDGGGEVGGGGGAEEETVQHPLKIEQQLSTLVQWVSKKRDEKKKVRLLQLNIARGTTDPGYRVYNLNYLFN